MSPEMRGKLAEVLKWYDLGEFKIDKVSFPPAKELFERHSQIFEACARGIASVSPKRKQVPFVFLDRYDLNACAFRYGDESFIGINHGAVLVLYDLFLRMMAAPTFMPEIGNAAGEEAFEKLPRLETDCSALPRTTQLPYGLVTAPYDPVRTVYAMHLAQIALDFLFLHEHRHIEGGHLLWADPNVQCMAQVETVPLEELVTRHVLELEADVGAANFSLKLACDMKGNKWRIHDLISPYQATLESRYTAWLVAIFTLFSVLEAADRRLSPGSPPSHPSAIFMRMYFAQFLFAAYGPLSEEESLRLCARLFDMVHRTLRSLFEEPISTVFKFDLFGPDRQAHMRVLGERWRAMSPRLRALGALNGCEPIPDDLRDGFLSS